MKRRGVIPAVFLLAALRIHAADGFDRYQLIIDKRPFGEEPPENEAVQIPLTQSFAKNLRLAMLFEGPDGDVRVGVIDASTQKNLILRIGQEEEGLELVEADLKASEAMIRKGNEVALFKLESGQPETLTASQQAARRSSYEDRRRARLAAQPAQPAAEPQSEPEQPRLTGEALRQHLEKVQMDAIRQGLPPLPLPLTPEMDAQLVKEGILPPQ